MRLLGLNLLQGGVIAEWTARMPLQVVRVTAGTCQPTLASASAGLPCLSELRYIGLNKCTHTSTCCHQILTQDCVARNQYQGVRLP
jgi:hypothetical protein